MSSAEPPHTSEPNPLTPSAKRPKIKIKYDMKVTGLFMFDSLFDWTRFFHRKEPEKSPNFEKKTQEDLVGSVPFHLLVVIVTRLVYIFTFSFIISKGSVVYT